MLQMNQHLEEGRSLKSLAAEYGVSHASISNWTKQFREECQANEIAGEQGEYGKQITMSAGTDMEESFYAYYVSAGLYTVINEGEYMTQISVYEGFAKNEETGYYEYTNTGDIVLLDVGEKATINITEGWFIEIQEPAHISLTPVNNE